MRRFFNPTFAFLLLFLTVELRGEVAIGTSLPAITLDNKLGGKVTGGPWSSEELKGKVCTIFYVDPDENTLNDHVTVALKAEKFPLEKFCSVAIVNMAATWKPNRIIESVMVERQKEFPNTVYVKDLDKVLVNKWKLADDNSDVLAFDKEGKVIFAKYGKLSESEIQALIAAIKASL